jgi:hypothetical protein
VLLLLLLLLPAGPASGGHSSEELATVVASLRAQLVAAQATAADSHSTNLSLGADLTVMERKLRNQVGPSL